MRKLFEAFRNIITTPDLRNRCLFTLMILAVYRLGAFITTPGINSSSVAIFGGIEKRRRPRPQKNHPVHALSHHHSQHLPVVRDCRHPPASESRGPAARL